jgi:DNA (cytosine-5)-methyltransferase 1
VRILDLFCGAGGCSMGYSRAFPDAEIVGVDINPQPRYPFTFVQADAMTYPLDGFDFIHASPPCQAYSAGRNIWKGRLADDRHPDLVDPTRARLIAADVPYVIENVVGAPLRNYVVLCGDMFGLGVKRHRLFETSFIVWNPPTCRADHPDFFVSVFGGGAKAKKKGRGFPKTNVVHAAASAAMGIDWMNRDEMSQAIPPAYTEFIGHALAAHLMERAA